jgi:hypothetical protein
MGGGESDNDSSESEDHGDDDDVEDKGIDSSKRRQCPRKRRLVSKNIGVECRDSEEDCVEKCVDISCAPKIITRGSAKRNRESQVDAEVGLQDEEGGLEEVEAEYNGMLVREAGVEKDAEHDLKELGAVDEERGEEEGGLDGEENG